MNFTRELLKLRREHPALANAADFRPLYAEKNQYPFVYLRASATERILVAINPSERPCRVTLESIKPVPMRPLLVQDATFHEGRFEMGPVSFAIFGAGN